MSNETWIAVDRYFTDLLVQADPALDAALEATEAAGLPPISVSPCMGKLLHLLTRMHRVRNILEIGTLGGYSTIWMARALPADGRLVTLEADPKHAEIARSNIARAGVSHLVDVRVGPAIDTLPRLEKDGVAPFDLIFIDADKPSTPEYFGWALQLSRPGSLIIVDNVVRGGAIVEGASRDASVQGMRRFAAMLASEPRVSATAIQTVSGKGYDGFVLALVSSRL
jgi:predicted O-methyltransferase YrrM